MKLRLLAALVLGAALASAANDAATRLTAAATSFKEVMGIPDKSIPQDLLGKAYCIVIVPDLKKGAFVFGAKYGKGFVSCRKKDGVGWSAPGSIRVEGGSFGFQIGDMRQGRSSAGARHKIKLILSNDFSAAVKSRQQLAATIAAFRPSFVRAYAPGEARTKRVGRERDA